MENLEEEYAALCVKYYILLSEKLGLQYQDLFHLRMIVKRYEGKDHSKLLNMYEEIEENWKEVKT